jgi:hypothetical protein
MGRDLDGLRFDREDRQRYREKVKRDLEVLRGMLDAGWFERGRKLVGVEVEFYVVDDDGVPMMINEPLLERIESSDFQTELAQFNIEFNLAPHKLSGSVFSEIEEELESSFGHAQRRARELGAHVMMIGILPTVEDLHVTIQSLSTNRRYHLLNEQVLEARGEDVQLDISGEERLTLHAPSIALEAAATSVQLHLQVSADGFARTYNAAQAVAAAQVAMGANSPFLLGKQLWQETRIALFEQIIDTRTEELAAQGVRPRVWFGEGWVNSVMDLFEENVRYFPALLPIVEDEEPEELVEEGSIPHLPELVLHNGTIWRWNRPVYGVARGKPHLRVENRVLPAGPTVVDTVANAAFYIGMVRGVAELDEPIHHRLPFELAARSFRSAARDGIDAEVHWPDRGTSRATDLVLDTLLPLAHRGLDAWGVDPRQRDHYLDIIEQRARLGRNGASWQVDAYDALREQRGLDRAAALVEVTRYYIEAMRANVPVHTWELPRPGP